MKTKTNLPTKIHAKPHSNRHRPALMTLALAAGVLGTSSCSDSNDNRDNRDMHDSNHRGNNTDHRN